jgi:hypothetical protein
VAFSQPTQLWASLPVHRKAFRCTSEPTPWFTVRAAAVLPVVDRRLPDHRARLAADGLRRAALLTRIVATVCFVLSVPVGPGFSIACSLRGSGVGSLRTTSTYVAADPQNAHMRGNAMLNGTGRSRCREPQLWAPP